MKVGELVDSVENSILQHFSTLYCAVSVVQGCKNHKHCIFGMLPPLKIIITFVLYKLQISYGANEMLFRDM
jgi:hypothetical protein